MGKTESPNERIARMQKRHLALLDRKNEPMEEGHGWYERYRYPVLTANHVPLDWRYDLDPERNTFMMERLAVNAVFNAGAIYLDGCYVVIARVEGVDRKSFFAVAESPSGIDCFRFWERPVTMPETKDPDTNVYDMRLTRHEDGWIYGLFCTERRDPTAPPGDHSSAVAQCGIARTRDLLEWERLPDLKTPSPQQRNVVLHPEFVGGKYALYTRPQDAFVSAGSGGGIGWALCDSLTDAIVETEHIIDERRYHSVKEVKNGAGPPPIRTDAGWLHLAHGVRNTAAGLRYVLYVLLTDLAEPSRVIAAPGGHFIAPHGEERVGDVSNVVFSNGWIADDHGDVFIYYASSDTRLHVATTTIDRLVDYAINTPPDSGRSATAVEQRNALISHNMTVASKRQ